MRNFLRKTIGAFLGFVLAIYSTQLLAFESNEKTQVGRYLISSDKPLPEQKNLMLQTIQVRFPPQVKTVGDAIKYILKPSGYVLAPIDKASSKVKEMFAFELPVVDRNFGPMTLEEALKTLAGNSFVLRVDQLNRQISFHVYQNDEINYTGINS